MYVLEDPVPYTANRPHAPAGQPGIVPQIPQPYPYENSVTLLSLHLY